MGFGFTEVGLALALISMAGGGIIGVNPSYAWAGWALIMVAGVGSIALARSHLISKRLNKRWTRLTAHNAALFCGLLFICFAGEGFRSSLQSTAMQDDKQEDLRVSFQFFSSGPSKRSVTYQFRNFGRQAALVRGLALLRIAESRNVRDLRKDLDQCQGFDRKSIQSLGMLQRVFGNGFQLTDDGKRIGEYDSQEIRINGESWHGVFPIVIGAGDAKTISIDFVILPEDPKAVAIMTDCPIVATINLGNMTNVAICDGWTASLSLDVLETLTSASTYRILPQATNNKCPLVETEILSRATVRLLSH
jgi:hypothetical protein